VADELAGDLDAGRQAVAPASVDNKLQAKDWDNWLEFCSNARRDPYLLHSEKPV
jgi:hypothetical protein